MNRKQRRQARHRNPALEARAKFEDALRHELKKRDIVLVSASTAEQGKLPCWVLDVRRGELGMTLSAKPQSVILLAEAVKARFDNPKLAEQEAQAAITGASPVQPSGPPAATAAAPGKGPLIELSDDPETAATQLLDLDAKVAYDALLVDHELLPGAR